MSDESVSGSFPATAAARCPGPGHQLGGICLSRLPCVRHGVTDAATAIALYGCVYEQREREIALHIEPRLT